MTTTPSPTKRLALPTAAPTRPTETIRGSFAEAARTPFEDLVRFNAVKARQNVARGHQLPPSPHEPLTKRTLGPTQSMPSFSSTYSRPQAQSHVFQTTQQINESVFGSGGSYNSRSRANELRPMWDMGSTANGGGLERSQSATASGSGIFGGSALSYGDSGTRSRSTTMETEVEDGDGFDMEEVYGGRESGFKGSFGGTNSDQEDSQGSTRTVTQGLKRAFEFDEPTTSTTSRTEEDDEEMEDTEDEEETEGVEAMSMEFKIPRVGGYRPIAGRRGLSKTQSLPASVFSSGHF